MFLDRVEGSPSLELVNLVLNMQARGEKIYSLAIGEPSFNTPREIIDAAYKAMVSGDVHYTSSYGTTEFREAAVRKLRAKNGIKAAVDNVVFVTTKFAVYAALMAVSQEPYEALIPDPGYFYSEPVILSNGTPVYYRLNEDFSLNLEEIHRKMNSRTRAIIVNSPSNPTGKVYSKSELAELYELCREKGVHIISDEAYEDIVYSKPNFSVGSLEDEPNLVVSLYSLSKSYSMTGWRAGYLVGSERVVHLVNKLLENTMTCFPPFIQHAAAYALDHGDRFIEEFRREFAERRRIVYEHLRDVDRVRLNEAEGAFYVFPSLSIRTPTMRFARDLLQNQNVALLPGVSFGPSGEGHVRISYSGSVEVIEEALRRFKTFLKDYH
ncbi:MAG: aminotransferase class I/II-fold pyridoxal phosphate-dependent enzyme [Thermoprotei archaeon]